MQNAQTHSERMSFNHTPEPTKKLMTNAVKHVLRSLRKVVFAMLANATQKTGCVGPSVRARRTFALVCSGVLWTERWTEL